MAVLNFGQVTINAINPKALAEFYAGLMGGVVRDFGNGYVAVTPPDPEGHADQEFDELEFRAQLPQPVPGLVIGNLLFQPADAPSPAPGWVHLDCEAADGDVDAAIAAVVAAGGQLVEKRGGGPVSWTVMADPEGNPFCIVG